MKATEEQYEAAVKIYSEWGRSAVYKYADKIGVDEDSPCPYCDTETPDYADQRNTIRCLVCGSHKYEVTPTLGFLQSFSSMRLDRQQAKMVDDFLTGKCEHPI